MDAQIDHGVGEGAAHIELKGEVVQPLGVSLVVMLLGPDPSGDHVVLHSVVESTSKVPGEKCSEIYININCGLLEYCSDHWSKIITIEERNKKVFLLY